MAEPVSISSGIAARYAAAVFELARDGNAIAALEAGIGPLQEALDASAELREAIASPILTRAEQERAITALAARLDLPEILAHTLALMARKRRLFVLPQLLAQLRVLIARDKGEVSAEVTAARALTKAQSEKLARALRDSVGKDVKVNVTIDEALVGGLVVKVGSQMIDSSIRSKLANLQNAMKEVR